MLQLFDLLTSLAFYRDALGFGVVGDVPEDGQCDFAMLRLDDAEGRPPQPDPARIAAHGDTALFFDCADVAVA